MDFWSVMGNIATICGIVSFTPIIWIAKYMYTEKKKRQAESRIKGNTNTGTLDGALVVSVGGTKNIVNDVKEYIRNNEDLQKLIDVSDKNRFFEYYHGDINEVVDTENAVDAVMEEIDKIIHSMGDSAIRTVHFFFMGPSQFAAKIGARLGNNYRVKCYHHPRNVAETYYISFGFLENSKNS